MQEEAQPEPPEAELEADLEPVELEPEKPTPPVQRPVAGRSVAGRSGSGRSKPKGKRRRGGPRTSIELYKRYPTLYRISAVAGFLLLLGGIAVGAMWGLDEGYEKLTVAMVALGFGGVCGLVGKLLPALLVYVTLAVLWLLFLGVSLAAAFAAFLGICAALNHFGV